MSSEDVLFAPRARVYVYRLPPKLSTGYCFDGGHLIPFLCVDWFDASIAGGKDEITEFIKTKRYFVPTGRFLVLSEECPDLTFVIGASGAS